MKIYYFGKSIIRKTSHFGNFEYLHCISKEQLIKEANYRLDCLNKEWLTVEEIQNIIEKEVKPFDFYSVQFRGEYDETVTDCCCKTYEDAQREIKIALAEMEVSENANPYIIVGQWFNEPYVEYFSDM